MLQFAQCRMTYSRSIFKSLLPPFLGITFPALESPPGSDASFFSHGIKLTDLCSFGCFLPVGFVFILHVLVKCGCLHYKCWIQGTSAHFIHLQQWQEHVHILVCPRKWEGRQTQACGITWWRDTGTPPTHNTSQLSVKWLVLKRHFQLLTILRQVKPLSITGYTFFYFAKFKT